MCDNKIQTTSGARHKHVCLYIFTFNREHSNPSILNGWNNPRRGKSNVSKANRL